MTIQGKRVLVVGGTSGIGAAVARMAVAAGAEVTTASRREVAPTDPGAVHFRLHISDEAQVRSCLSEKRPYRIESNYLADIMRQTCTHCLMGEKVSSLISARKRAPPHPPQRGGFPATPLKMSGAVDTLCRLKIGQGAMA